MLPEKLNLENGKNHWYYADAFGPGVQALIQSFMHFNYSIGMHTHDFWELNIVMDGVGGHYIGKNRFEIKSGDVFVIPPNVSHGYYNLDKLNVYHMLIHDLFIKTYMQELAKYSGYAALFEIEPYLRGVCPKHLFLNLSSGQLKWLAQYINNIKTYSESICAFKEALINSAALSLISHLCYLADLYHALGTDAQNGQAFSMIQCLNYIHANYDKHLTIDFLARSCNMSRASFIRAFKENCGVPPHKYIMALRLRTARKLIYESGLSVTEAAHECGFYDAAHLGKCMDKYSGD